MGSKIKVQGVMSLDQAVRHLEEILEALKQGGVRLQAGEDILVVQPQAMVEFEMKAARKKDKEKIEIEISWTAGDKIIVGEPGKKD